MYHDCLTIANFNLDDLADSSIGNTDLIQETFHEKNLKLHPSLIEFKDKFETRILTEDIHFEYDPEDIKALDEQKESPLKDE
jgi:hypothetical protein